MANTRSLQLCLVFMALLVICSCQWWENIEDFPNFAQCEDGRYDEAIDCYECAKRQSLFSRTYTYKRCCQGWQIFLDYCNDQLLTSTQE